VKIIAMTDIHGKVDAAHFIAAELRAADVVLLPGDLTNFGNRDEAARIVDVVRTYNPKVLAVMGNCDRHEVEQYLTDEGLCLHRRHQTIDGVVFAGLGGSLPCPVRTLNEWSEEQIAEHLDAAIEGAPADVPLVLVSHQPARDTVTDLAGIGLHVGSAAVRAFIERRKPVLCFSGHIHEAQGTGHIGPATLVNPGPFMEGRYAWAELSGGVCRVEIRQAGAQ
jgi:hypothetical protein